MQDFKNTKQYSKQYNEPQHNHHPDGTVIDSWVILFHLHVFSSPFLIVPWIILKEPPASYHFMYKYYSQYLSFIMATKKPLIRGGNKTFNHLFIAGYFIVSDFSVMNDIVFDIFLYTVTTCSQFQTGNSWMEAYKHFFGSI